MRNINEITDSLHNHQEFPCEICPMAQQNKLPFPISSITSKDCFELLYIDTWGPYKTPTYKGERYFLSIADDFSRGIYTFFLSTKSNAFSALKTFLALVERQFATKVKIIRSNNAYELGTGNLQSKYFSSKGIMHQTSCTTASQQNGAVERNHKHRLETCRALVYQSHLPKKFWGDCLLTST